MLRNYHLRTHLYCNIFAGEWLEREWWQGVWHATEENDSDIEGQRIVVGHVHQGFLEMFRQRKQLAAELIDEVFGIEIPKYSQVQEASNDLTYLQPNEFTSDGFFLYQDDNAKNLLGVIVEIQNREPDEDKRWDFAAYYINARERVRCKILVLVLCPNRKVAEACGEALQFDAKMGFFQPLALDGSSIPPVLDPKTAADNPERAFLSFIGHAREPGLGARVAAFTAAINALGKPAKNQETTPEAAEKTASELPWLYYRVVSELLPKTLMKEVAHIMTMMVEHGEFDNPFFDCLRKTAEERGLEKGLEKGLEQGLEQGREQGLEQGRIEERVRTILVILGVRGVAIPEAVEARIVKSTDLDELDEWVRRAVEARAIDDLFR